MTRRLVFEKHTDGKGGDSAAGRSWATPCGFPGPRKAGAGCQALAPSPGPSSRGSAPPPPLLSTWQEQQLPWVQQAPQGGAHDTASNPIPAQRNQPRELWLKASHLLLEVPEMPRPPVATAQAGSYGDSVTLTRPLSPWAPCCECRAAPWGAGTFAWVEPRYGWVDGGPRAGDEHREWPAGPSQDTVSSGRKAVWSRAGLGTRPTHLPGGAAQRGLRGLLTGHPGCARRVQALRREARSARPAPRRSRARGQAGGRPHSGQARPGPRGPRSSSPSRQAEPSRWPPHLESPSSALRAARHLGKAPSHLCASLPTATDLPASPP